jgi:glycosyltransferase involved in cell wall biosynthesis
LKVDLVTGSYPPEVCGIGHYTYRLAQSLRAAGADVEVLAGPGWGTRRIFTIAGNLGLRKSDLLHIQYPSEGFGWSVAPQIVSLLRPSIVTIHELSRVGFLRKLSIVPFLIAARRLIFTSTFELAFASRRMPWIKKKSTVIEIGSNIPVPADRGRRKLDEIIYFGLIVPNKGIEEVLHLASLLQQKAPGLRVRIVGATVPRFSDYASSLRELSRDLPVELEFDMNDEATGRRLSESAVAYLPFPQGATIGRGSVKALLTCGTAVITTRGPQTTAPLAETVLFASDAEEALKLSLELLRDPGRLERISAASVEYSRTFGWEKIAAEHLEVYRQFDTGK